MDDLDHKLIALLRGDARLPVSSLSAALRVSRATVRARIDRLLESGVIQGFTVALNAEGKSNAVRAITLIEVEGQAADRVIHQLQGFPEVTALHTTNGKWDVIAEIEADTLAAFDDVLRRIRLVGGIAATETNILLASRKLSGRI